MIKRIFTYILILLAFIGCSDDLDNYNPGHLDEDGTLHLSFGIAPMTSIFTRTGDTPTTVEMYVFNGSTGAQLQTQTLTLDQANSATVMLKKEVLATGANPLFYFVANKPTIESGSDSSKGGLLGATTLAIENGGNFVMSSKSEGIPLADIESTIILYHNAAKITVNDAEATSDTQNYPLGYKPGSKSYDFIAQGTATESLLMAGGLNQGNASSGLGKPNRENMSGEDEFVSELFVHPTDNTSTGNIKKSWIIIKAQYPVDKADAPYYYYRLDFQDRQGDSDEGIAVDIRPNYKYEFLIRDILSPGYNSIQEAADNPTPLSVLNYIIYDHAPVVFNTVSDGKRLLGVSKSVTCDNADGGDATFYVKLYSPESSEMDEITVSTNIANIFDIPVSWLTVSTTNLPSKVSGEDYYGENTGVGTGDNIVANGGNIYKVTVTFGETKDPGTLKSKLTVNWHGLSRSVDVIWNREFDASKIFDPDVKIKIFKKNLDFSKNLDELWYSEDGIYTEHGILNEIVDGKKEGMKYFNSDNGFLKKLVEGVSIDDNNGNYRDDGLHFPMPYGDSDDKWTYIYKLTLSQGIFSDATGDDKGYWDVAASGLSGLKIQKPATRDKDNRVFYLYRSSKYKTNGEKDFKYEEGSLKITVKINGKEISYNNVKLYHTGFFHWDNVNSDKSSTVNEYVSSISGTPQHSGKFTYYEVVKVGEGEDAEYWLDRNMGARSAQSHIDGGSQNQRAVGFYMVAAKYHEYHNPTLYENTVPPGYQVPNVAQWNKLKNAPNFNIVQVGSDYNPTLLVGTKEVYFPKARYYDGNVANNQKQGEARCGYYWTRDPGTGTEKKEVGNWLRSVQFAGTATSVINARVHGKDNGKGYYMSMRAVADLGRTATYPEKFYFLVNGVTHVYLYKGEGVDRTAAYTWPGKSIGNYTTANKTFSFSYETTTSSPEELKVIFNFVDDEGIIHTYSKNEFGETVTHDNIRPADAIGWSVINTDKNEAGAFPSGCGVTISNANNSEATSQNVSCNGTLWTVASPKIKDYKFALDGEAFNGWNKDNIDFKYDKKSKTWKVQAKVNSDGQFGIRKIPNSGNKSFYNSSESANPATVLTDGSKNGVKEGGNNWTISVGLYNFEFNEDENWLKITEVEIPKYRIYWSKSIKVDWIHFWTNIGITSFGNAKDNGNSDVAGYYCYDFTDTKGADLTKEFKYCFAGNTDKSSGKTFEELFAAKDANGYYCAYVTANDNNKAFPGKPAGSTPVSSTYRILWPTTGEYNQIKVTDVTRSTRSTRSSNGFVDANGPENGKYYYDLTTDQTSVKFEFKNSSSGKTAKPAGDPTYTLTDISEEADGKKILTIGNLVEQQSGSEEITYKILWPKTNFDNNEMYKIKIINSETGEVLQNFIKYDNEDHSVGYNNGSYFYKEFKTKATKLKFEFGNDTETVTIPNPDKVYTTADANKTTDKGTGCIVVESIQKKTSTSVDPRKAFQDATPNDQRCVFWDNTGRGWTTVKIHYWGGDNPTSWPGDDMTKIPNTNYWYKYIPSNTTGVIFNNGNGGKDNQTNDVTLKSDGTYEDNTYKIGQDDVTMMTN